MKQPDPKPARRIKATRKEWNQIREALLGGRWCAVCGAHRAETLHHVVRKSQGGDDVAVNCLEVCGHGTAGCHGDLEARDPYALAEARRAIYSRPATRGYVLQKKGQAWLDRSYPTLVVRRRAA